MKAHRDALAAAATCLFYYEAVEVAIEALIQLGFYSKAREDLEKILPYVPDKDKVQATLKRIRNKVMSLCSTSVDLCARFRRTIRRSR